MNFFKFESETDPTSLEQGEQINGIKSALWVERYSEPGEFSFEAQLSAGLKDFLPLGTLISHVDTLEVMIVENHEIKETEKIDPTLVITGRSFPSYLEQRIVGVNLARIKVESGPYTLNADYSWNQIVKLINDHIVDTAVPEDALVDVLSGTLLTGTGESVPRTIDYGNVWERVAELLQIDKLGIKTIRRNTFGIGDAGNTVLLIHNGIDRSADVLFSWKAGDLSSAEYLFSNKNDKNSALVLSVYLFLMVDAGPTKYDRRTMLVDASDIDRHMSDVPMGLTRTQALAAMTTRGYQALAAQNQITMSRADISKTTKYQYRRDYDIGDLVSIDGHYGQIDIMRVVEYAEIEDENGESGHPTLALPGG